MRELESNLKNYFDLPDEQLSEVAGFFTKDKLKKGDFLLKLESYHHRMAFVHSGMLRVYTLRDHKEITQWISTPGYLTADLSGFMFTQPSRWNIQFINDCELFTITPAGEVEYPSGLRLKEYF